MPRSLFFTIRSDPKPVNNIYFFSKLSNEKTKQNSQKKAHANVTVTMVRDRKIQTALRTNQIVGFITVPAWRKINLFIQNDCVSSHFQTLRSELILFIVEGS